MRFCNQVREIISRVNPVSLPGVFAALFMSAIALADDDDNRFRIEEAVWEAGDSKLFVKGKGREDETVIVSNADTELVIGSDDVNDDDKWRVTSRRPSSVPCRVRAEQSNGR